MGPINSPCKNCKDRHFKCHSDCKKYLNFKHVLNTYNKKVKEEKRLYFAILGKDYYAKFM